MNILSSLFNSELFVFSVVTLCVVVMFYMHADRVISFFEAKSLKQKDEILGLLDLMSIETDRRKLTMGLMLVSFGLAFVTFLLLLPNVMGGFIFSLMVGYAGWMVPLLIVKSLYEKRCNQFVDQMVDGLAIMSNGVKAGKPAVEAMKRVVESLPNPISYEFSLVIDKVQNKGASFEEALVQMNERIPRPDVQMFVLSVGLLTETGGRLQDTLETIAMTIRERQKIHKKIDAMTAQGVFQGIVITLVPLFMIAMFFFIDANYIKPMFTTTLGLILLACVLALQVIGGIAIKKIITIKV